MEKVIVRYYRKGYKVPRGCVVGIVDDGLYKIGYSLYNRKLEQIAGVSFTKKRAMQIAKGRAIKAKALCYAVPPSLFKTMEKVVEQCNKIVGIKEGV